MESKIYLYITLLLTMLGTAAAEAEQPVSIPSYLKGYEEIYKANPRAANRLWFRQAKYGMFIHWGLYSLEGIDPFEQQKLMIPVSEYEKKMERFTGENFDADFIAELAVRSRMKYITFVTKHCEGFCLWDTRYTEFNSMNSAAKRDFVQELYDACEKHRLGLFLFYEYGFEWHHPHSPSVEEIGPSAIDYEGKTGKQEPCYAYGAEHDISKFVDYAHNQMLELVERYPNVAGIWIDGAGPLQRMPEIFRLQELYDAIHAKSPHALISCKWGIPGTEDFYAPEQHQFLNFFDSGTIMPGTKPLEICNTLSPGWGFNRDQTAWRPDTENVRQWLKLTSYLDANLLLNIGPDGTGRVTEQEQQILGEVAAWLNENGFPAPEEGQAIFESMWLTFKDYRKKKKH